MYGIFYLSDFVREKVGKYSSTMEHMGIQLYHISKGYTGDTWLYHLHSLVGFSTPWNL